MMNYMSLSDTVEILTEVARTAGIGSATRHPEDVANSMIVAIEGAASALTVLAKKDVKL